MVLKVATPEPLKVPDPSLVLPSKKVTVPAGIPPLPPTVAVKVTRLPTSAGFCEEARAVVLVLRITCERRLEPLAAKELLPPYTAVME